MLLRRALCALAMAFDVASRVIQKTIEWMCSMWSVENYQRKMSGGSTDHCVVIRRVLAS